MVGAPVPVFLPIIPSSHTGVKFPVHEMPLASDSSDSEEYSSPAPGHLLCQFDRFGYLVYN